MANECIRIVLHNFITDLSKSIFCEAVSRETVMVSHKEVTASVFRASSSILDSMTSDGSVLTSRCCLHTNLIAFVRAKKLLY